MIKITDKKQCCGCASCAQKCPNKCISLQVDNEGFLYPIVDHTNCINCGLCEKVCPVLNPSKEKYPIKVYGCKNKSLDVRLASSSGGLFSAIATEFIILGGVVFGVSFNDKWEAVFSYADNLDDLQKFRGSKYIQAYVGNAYKDAEEILKSGKRVLFSGTSCQIAGLKRFLQKQYDNLFTIDFICHGVPSQKLFREYLQEEIGKYAKKVNFGKRIVSSSLNEQFLITDIKFREKRIGWKNYCFVLTLDELTNEGKKTSVLFSRLFDTSYGRLFLTDLSLRPSCYECPAKSGRAESDITMADFWGIQSFYPDFDDDKGVSLAIVNSERGNDIIPFNKLDIIKPSLDEALTNNAGFFNSVKCPAKRELFWELYEDNYNLSEIIAILYPKPIRERIKMIIKKFLHVNYGINSNTDTSLRS